MICRAFMFNSFHQDCLSSFSLFIGDKNKSVFLGTCTFASDERRIFLRDEASSGSCLSCSGPKVELASSFVRVLLIKCSSRSPFACFRYLYTKHRFFLTSFLLGLFEKQGFRTWDSRKSTKIIQWSELISNLNNEQLNAVIRRSRTWDTHIWSIILFPGF